MSHDGGRRTFSMDNLTDDARPRVFVAAGNWAIP